MYSDPAKLVTMLTGKWSKEVLEEETLLQEKQLQRCDTRGRLIFERLNGLSQKYDEKKNLWKTLKEKWTCEKTEELKEKLETLDYDRQELEAEMSDLQSELKEQALLKAKLTKRLKELRSLKQAVE